MSLIDHPILGFPADRGARALQRWRDASRLVWTRWYVYLDAEPDGRELAFASYLAAVDAEELEAARLAGSLPGERPNREREMRLLTTTPNERGAGRAR